MWWLLEVSQFPLAWVYLSLVNLFILLYLRRLRRAESSPESLAANAQKAVLFVTAHPDDEAMFFVPTIVGLRRLGYRLHLLCLSNGDAAGKGKTREKELERACQILGFEEARVVDDPKLPDGMQSYWQLADIERHLGEQLQRHRYSGLITFDAGGVSGHLNHVAVFQAVKALRRQEASRGLKIFVLDTVALPRKFIGLLDAVFSLLEEVVFVHNRFWLNWKAMWAHRSQFVWFRCLFLLFSRYVYVNTLTELPFTSLVPDALAAETASKPKAD